MHYEIGHVVKLMSGGPSMTVVEVNTEEGIVTTAWFSEAVEDREVHEAEFPAAALRGVPA